MVSQDFNDHEPLGDKKSDKPEWEPTTLDTEDSKDEDTYYISNSPDVFDQENDAQTRHPFNDNSAQGMVSNVLMLKVKAGHPPSPQQLGNLLQTALDQGWETLYVYKADKKTPDLQMAQYIQQFIFQQNLHEKINCCLSPAEYRKYDGLEGLQKENELKGATPQPNVNI
jgi:hypothetical protein